MESEGVVLSPSSVSQMLSSPSESRVEEIFAPNEVVVNSPLDELIREVSVSPTEELSEPKSTMLNVSLLNPVLESTQVLNQPKKRTKKDINPTVKKKPLVIDNVNKLKPVSSTRPYVIKIEPAGDDPPVISIPEMNFLESEE